MTRTAAVLIVALWCAGCGQPFAPSGAGDAFTYPDSLRPVMQALDDDPWIHPLLGEPMGAYVRHHAAGIVLDDRLPAECGAEFDRDTHLIHWQPRNTPDRMSAVLLAGVLLHEARHGAGFRHDCDGRDRSFEQGGAFAVHILYLEQQQFAAEAAMLRRDWIGCH